MRKLLLMFMFCALSIVTRAQEITFDPSTSPVRVAVGETFTFKVKQLQGFDGSNVTSSSMTLLDGATDEDCSVAVQTGHALTNALYGEVPIVVTPHKVGTYKIKVYLSTKYDYNGGGGNEAENTFMINAYDPALASSLSITPESPVTVDMGGTTTVTVNLDPTTADLDISEVTGLSGVTATLNGKSTVTIDATAATSTGEAEFTLSPKVGSTAPSITVKVNVVPPHVPVTASCPSTIRMGESLPTSAVLGGGLNPNDYTFEYSSDATSILTVNGEGVLTPVALGNANVTIKVTGGSYDTFSETFPVTVEKGVYTLSLTPNQSTVGIGIGGESTITPTVTLNDIPVQTGYTINYTLKSIPTGSGVTISGNVVNIPNTVTETGSVVVGATLSASENPENFNSPEADATIYIDKVPTIELNTQVPGNKIDTYLETNNWDYIQINPTAVVRDKEGNEVMSSLSYNYEIIQGGDKIHMDVAKIIPDAEGNAQIKVTVTTTYDGITVSDSKIVDVEVKVPTGIVTATENSVTIEKNESHKITLTQEWTGLDKNQSNLSYDISSDNGTIAIATINKGGDEENIVTIDAVGVGTTTIHIKGIAKKGTHTFETTVKDIEVTVPTVTPTVDVASLSVNHDQKLSLATIESAVTVTADGNTLVKGEDYDIVVKYASNEEVITSEGINGANYEDAEHSQTSVAIKIVVVSKKLSLYQSPAEKNVNVTLTHLLGIDLALTATPSASIMDNGQQAVITSSATYNTNTPVDISSYDVDYTLSAPDVATVVKNSDNTITVTGQNAGTVTVTVTAHPTEGSTYATATNTTTITVTESQKVYLTTETGADGKSYVVVNVPEGGAFGGISDTPKIDETKSTATLEELKNAAYVKVTGQISNSDAKELIHLIGDSNAGVTDNYCRVLDMGDANMTEALVVDGDGNWDKDSWINNYYGCSLWYLESLTLPKPVSGHTEIPTGMYNLWNTSATLFNSLAIPEGWTAVNSHAFATVEGNGLKGVTSLSLANSIETIGEYAFVDLNVLKSLAMPENLVEIKDHAFENCLALETLKLNSSLLKIGAYAFSSSQVVTITYPKDLEYIGAYAFSPAGKLSDVYFTGDGTKLKYVDRTAFSTQSQMCNNSVTDDDLNGEKMPTVDRTRYVNGGVLACIMHYPAGCDAEYTDVTRKYHVLNTSGVGEGPDVYPEYGKGNYTYIPKGTYEDETTWQWDATFLEMINNEAADWSLHTDDPHMDGAFPDATYGYDMIWPSQSEKVTGFAIANAGYLWNMQPMSTAQLDPSNGVDKRGLYQFIVALDNAPTDHKEWPFKYQQNLWYTISLPFNMTPAEIRKVFGDETQVCRISNVLRDTSDPDHKILHLEFRNSVMEENDDRPKDIEYTENVYAGDNIVGLSSFEQAGIRHHHPYMIKPSGVVDLEDATIKFNPTTGERVFSGYETIPGKLYDETVRAKDKDGNYVTKGGNYLYYYFRPFLSKGTIQKNSYVLTKYNGKHQYVFYKGVSAGDGTYIDGGTLNANTAYVQLSNGQDDFNDFFPNAVGNNVKFMSYFGDFYDDDLTDIDEVEIVCGDEESTNGNIYNLNGVRVSGKSLAPGLYIKNGKKYFVK